MFYGSETGSGGWRRLSQCPANLEIVEVKNAQDFYSNTFAVVCAGGANVGAGEKESFETNLEGVMQLGAGLPADYTLMEEYDFVQALFAKINTLASALERHVGSMWADYRAEYSKYLAALDAEAELAKAQLSPEKQAELSQRQEELKAATLPYTFRWYEDPKIILPVMFSALGLIGIGIWWNHQRSL